MTVALRTATPVFLVCVPTGHSLYLNILQNLRNI